MQTLRSCSSNPHRRPRVMRGVRRVRSGLSGLGRLSRGVLEENVAVPEPDSLPPPLMDACLGSKRWWEVWRGRWMRLKRRWTLVRRRRGL